MNKKIIVVEDESLIALDIKKILEREGYEVITNIKTVETAIEAIEVHNPILVLIDINLNQLADGIDLGNYLLVKDTIPYIYITSYSNKMTLDRAQETRPHGYIVKPFRPDSIIASVSVVLNNYKYKKIDTIRSENPMEELTPKKMKQIVEYINANIHKKLDVELLLSITNWTKRHLSRIFMQYLNTTPHQYILNKRIEKASVLLKETDVPINEIAIELGFQNYSSFYSAFKRVTNETPESFRNK
ncbi:DNA-binding response regulator [Flavobacterium sp.]|uniref:response regulator transcription factor n=1 Tax=Flavobacterium sp. TaxID=239 RepID=UPI00286E7A47|nr:DNA-binding response regulator [Flavobacterium sp.]